MIAEIRITERGWGGHFICASRCRFRRNTLLEWEDNRIVVSTVGLMQNWEGDKIETVGYERYYETMAFKAKWEEPYWEADVCEQVDFDSPWSLNEKERESDWKANKMHETVITEVSEQMKTNKVKTYDDID